MSKAKPVRKSRFSRIMAGLAIMAGLVILWFDLPRMMDEGNWFWILLGIMLVLLGASEFIWPTTRKKR